MLMTKETKRYNTMRKMRFLFAVVAAVLLVSCGTTSTVPIVGRKQHLLVSDEQVLSLSNQQYQQYMKTAKASTDASNTAMVKRVGQRLATAVVKYLNDNGLSSEASSYQWAFNLVQDKNVNAFCMPGGKIVVYEGLLPVTQNEASLAIVLGHEIAHAVAKHSAERMSNQVRQQYGGQLLGAVLSGAGASADLQQIGSAVFGLGSNLGSAAYSRKQESEADHLGLVFAAMAGYDPSVAVPFWQRMAQSTGNSSASLFSDHPSDATRIADIQKWLPEAQKYYTAPATSTQSVKSTTTGTARKTSSQSKTTVKKSSAMPKTTKTIHF